MPLRSVRRAAWAERQRQLRGIEDNLSPTPSPKKLRRAVKKANKEVARKAAARKKVKK